MPPTLFVKGKIKILPHMIQQEIDDTKNKLAIDYIMTWFGKRVPARKGGYPMIPITSVNDRICVLKSGTGSGKSTTLPPEFHIRFFESTRRSTAITQPRILTAIETAENVAKLYTSKGLKMGENIGYQTGDYIFKPSVGVIYMTTEVLTQQLVSMPDWSFINKYVFIILDECHLRTLSMDSALSLFKQFIYRNIKNRECPFLILTSATFDTPKFADYFGVDQKNIIEVAGETNHPVSTTYLQAASTSFAEDAARLAYDIHRNNMGDTKITDILIFVSGSSATKEIIKYLDKKNKDEKAHYIILDLNSEIYNSGDVKYHNILRPLNLLSVEINGELHTPFRRIIISTDVAETGVTIETVKYLIDTGMVKTNKFNPHLGAYGLMEVPITRASAIQRRGRVGRLSPGEFYPMYTKSTMDSLQEDSFPDIMVTDITDTVLMIMVKRVFPNWSGHISDVPEVENNFSISDIDMMDFPPVDSMRYSMEKLYALGLITYNYVPTTMGLACMKIIAVPIEFKRFLFAGYSNKCNIIDMITISAFAIVGKMSWFDDRSKNRYYPTSVFGKSGSELEYYEKLLIADDYIRCIFLWEDFMDQVRNTEPLPVWCKENGIKYEGLLKVIKARDSLIDSFIQNLGLDPFYNGLDLKRGEYSLRQIFQTSLEMGVNEVVKIKKCVYEGFRMNVATFDAENGQYVLDVCHKQIIVKSNLVTPLSGSEFYQLRPNKIIVYDIKMAEKQFTGVLRLESDTISVIDGFIDVDTSYLF